MGVGVGLTGYLGIGQESVYGTPVARTNFFEINDESLSYNYTLIQSQALAKVGLRNTKVAQGVVNIGGDFSFDAPYAGWERLLKHGLGVITSSRPDVTSNPTVWDHTFTIGDDLPTSLTLEVFRGTEDFVTEPNKAFIYEGCVISSIGISVGVDDLLKITCSVIGEDENRGAKSTPSYDSSLLAVYHHGVVTWNNNDVEVHSFELSINNQLETRPKLGSRFTRRPKRSGKLEVMGSFQAEFVSWSEYDDFRAKTERQMVATFTGPVISGVYTNLITITIPIGIILSHRVVLNAPGRLVLEVSFRALRTDVAGELSILMRNLTTASLAG
jgi:hypothetical protein